MALYVRLAAVNYATRWALSRNPAFANFQGNGGGGDCTNFISQCLYAGGWRMNFWGKYEGLSWYYHSPDDLSKTWASADHFASFLETSNRGQRCSVNELTFGDLVSEELPPNGIRHWMMVTGVSSQERYLSYHTIDTLQISFTDMQKRAAPNPLTCWKMLDWYPAPHMFNDQFIVGTMLRA